MTPYQIFWQWCDPDDSDPYNYDPDYDPDDYNPFNNYDPDYDPNHLRFIDVNHSVRAEVCSSIFEVVQVNCAGENF